MRLFCHTKDGSYTVENWNMRLEAEFKDNEIIDGWIDVDYIRGDERGNIYVPIDVFITNIKGNF